METITFKGPFHFRDIGTEDDLKDSGIYIWGFMYDCDDKGKLKEPKDYLKNNIHDGEIVTKFLPYYVGIRKSSIKERLVEHHNIENGDRKKYIRFSLDYMKSFFIGDEDKFPINYSKSKRVDKLIEINKKEINVTYFNDKKFLEETYNKENYPEIFNNIIDNIDNTDYPINLFADLKGKDTLKEIIIDKDNFLFCYAPYKKVNNITFESFETLTFHSLKGKTISKTGIPKNIKNNIEVIDKTTAKIFKAQKNNKESINKHTKNGIVDFPGY